MNKMVTTFAPQTFSEAESFANKLASSGLVPDAYRGKPTDILVAIQWGYEIGLQPLQALQNISVIKGKPSVWGDTLLSLAAAHPAFAGCEENVKNNIATCKIKREVKGKIQETVRTFSKEDAMTADLWNKKGPWQTYPTRMLQMRARGFAIRDAFPDAIKGVISTEEAMDYPEPEMKTIHPHPFEETEGFKQIKEVLPNATVTRTQPHRSFLQEHQERWQSVTTADLLKIAAQDKAKLGEVLKLWREEALAVFEICTTQEQYVEVEKRFHTELTEIRNTGKGGSAWADKCFDAMVPQLTDIAERVSDNEINEKSKVYL